MVRAAICVAAAAVVAGCAALPEAPVPYGGFELSGRVAVRYAKEALSAQIFWRHADETDDLLITSPLGQSVARITRASDSLLLVTGDNKVYRAGNAEDLTEKALGWRLPLSGLANWVRGRARSAGLGESHPRAGDELREEGWLVTYEEFRDGYPSKLRLTREGLEIRVVVDTWKS